MQDYIHNDLIPKEKIKAMHDGYRAGLVPEAEYRAFKEALSAVVLELNPISRLHKIVTGEGPRIGSLTPTEYLQVLVERDAEEGGLHGLASLNANHYVVGLCGFSNPALSHLYAGRKHGVSQLSIYAKTFKSIEIQSTHHKFPTTDLMHKWASATPDDFIFSLRAPKTIRPGSKQAKTLMSMLLRRASVLGHKLGPIVITIPKGQGYLEGDAEAFFSSLPEHRYALLIESQDWDNGDVYSAAAAHDIAIVEGGPIGMKSTGWRYLRVDSNLFHGLRPCAAGENSIYAFVNARFPAERSQTEINRILHLLNLDRPLTNLAPAIPSISDPITGPSNRSTPVGANDERRDYPGVDAIESVDGDPEPRQNTYPDTEGVGIGKIKNKKDFEGGTGDVLRPQI